MRHPLLLVILALAACRSADPAAPVAPPTPASYSQFGYDISPRAYEVPPGRAAEVRRLVKGLAYPVSVVSAQGAQTQFVNPQPTFTSDGHVVLTLPGNYQAAVAELMKTVVAEGPGTESAYDVSYWVVRATPGQAFMAAPELGDIQPALEKVIGLGTRVYGIVDRVATRTLDGEESSIEGRSTKVEQTVSTSPGGLELEVKLTETHADGTANQIETKISLQPGQVVILGDATAPRDDKLLDGDVLLYVVRVSVAA